MRTPLKTLVAAAMGLALVSPSSADGLNPGSVLVYPFQRSEFPFGGSAFTIVVVTNTNLLPITPVNGLGGSTNVHFEFVNVVPDPNNPKLPFDCVIADRIELLTPADTRAFLTSCVNGTAGAEGYLVATALDPDTFADAWSHNYLVGSELVLNPSGALYYVNAIPFSSPLQQGALTDLDADGQLDFDGNEYEGVPDLLYIDQFTGLMNSSLALINLSGGTAFTANVAFDVWNDNEFALSATLAFRCWAECRLSEISVVFSQPFLANNTPNDPADLDIDCDNVNDLETGWARIRGLNHSSPVESCPDAALLGAISNQLPVANGGRRLWESKEKQLDGDFLKTGTDDPECNP